MENYNNNNLQYVKSKQAVAGNSSACAHKSLEESQSQH